METILIIIIICNKNDSLFIFFLNCIFSFFTCNVILYLRLNNSNNKKATTTTTTTTSIAKNNNSNNKYIQ